MRLLLDSHVLVWFAEGMALDPRVAGWIESAESDVHVSVATAWELGIKAASGKLPMKRSVREIAEHFDFRRLPLTWDHVEAAVALPPHHRDPWDRMLVAQAQTEGLSLVTDDPMIARYAVHTVPAR